MSEVPTKTSSDLPRACDLGLVSCHDCHHLNRWPTGHQGHIYCYYCHAPLHQRLQNSLNRTWALVLTSWVLVFPANLLPIMEVIYFGSGNPDTIMSGVVKMVDGGMYAIAALVFFASIAVPIMKLLGIMWVLMKLRSRQPIEPIGLTKLYRLIELIGRWSMLDLFMISILVTLVDLGKIATITAGPGATAFAGVVVLTMLAALSLDARLIWDQEDASLNGKG